MAVVTFSRYSGGNRDALIPLGKQSKAFHEKAGAEWLRVSLIHTGPHAGQWLVSIRWPDWAAYGKGQQTLQVTQRFRKSWLKSVNWFSCKIAWSLSASIFESPRRTQPIAYSL